MKCRGCGIIPQIKWAWREIRDGEMKKKRMNKKDNKKRDGETDEERCFRCVTPVMIKAPPAVMKMPPKQY